MITEQEALNALYRENLYAFAYRAFQIVEPGGEFEPSWHIDCICQHLMACYRGEIQRLIINLPPRTLKSYLVARVFPAWVMGKDASEKFISTSYGYEVTEQNSMACRRIMKDPWYQSVFPETKISADLDRNTHFETTKGGQYYAASALSPITGIGCFTADTLIDTSIGKMRIADLDSSTPPLILSYCHDTNQLVYRRMNGIRPKVSADIVDVQTTGGRKVRCTSDHRFYNDNEYREAGSMLQGSALLCNDSDSMPKVWQVEGQTIGSASRKAYSASERETKEAVSYLQRIILSCSQGYNLLLSLLCEYSPFKAYAGQAELQLSGWGGSLHNAILCSAGVNNGTGQQGLRGVFKSYRQDSGASYQREEGRQPPRESNNDVSTLSYNTPQITQDTVSTVEPVSCGEVTVYDIEVEGTHNFFANGILVHNCRFMVCDDLIKPMEAGSETIRTSTNQNIRQTLFSRFNDKRTGVFILVMQRVHEDDPTGHLLKDGGYVHLKLPAEAKAPIEITLNGKTWSMKEGDLLFPTRLSREILDQTRLDMSEVHYVGQYLQDPVPLGGGEFKPDEWLQFYQAGGVKPKEMNTVILCDPAGGKEINKKKKKSSDWTVMDCWGLANDNNYYLLDRIRDKLNPTERVDTLFMLHRKWNELTEKPPKVGYERYGMMSDLHYIKAKQREDAYNFPLVELGGQISKPERIRQLIPDMQKGRFYFPATLPYVDIEGRKFDLVKEMIDEMRNFPRSRWDDILDTMSRLYTPELYLQFPRPKVKMVAKAIRRAGQREESWENW